METNFVVLHANFIPDVKFDILATMFMKTAKKEIVFILLGLVLTHSSCTENAQPDAQSASIPIHSCEVMEMDSTSIELTGTLVISPKGELCFKSTLDDSLNIACVTFLIPCDHSLKEYIEGQYIGFASLRNIDESFWIIVSGKYLNLDEYRNQTENFQQLEFGFTHVALVDKPYISN